MVEEWFDRDFLESLDKLATGAFVVNNERKIVFWNRKLPAGTIHGTSKTRSRRLHSENENGFQNTCAFFHSSTNFRRQSDGCICHSE